MKQSIENALQSLENIISLEISNLNQENDGIIEAEDREDLFQDVSPELIVLAIKVMLMQHGIGHAKTPISFSFEVDGMEYSVSTKKVMEIVILKS